MTNPEARIIRIVLPALGLFFTLAASGAEPDLSECMKEQSDADRLACYDRMAEGTSDIEQSVPDATAAAEQQAADAEATASSPSGATAGIAADEAAEEIENFGMNRNVAEANDEIEPQLDQIYATIVDIETKRYGERVITLDNGQVWVEESATKAVRLEPGDEVRIKAGVLGSFRLFSASRRSTRVERIR